MMRSLEEYLSDAIEDRERTFFKVLQAIQDDIREAQEYSYAAGVSDAGRLEMVQEQLKYIMDRIENYPNNIVWGK